MRRSNREIYELKMSDGRPIDLYYNIVPVTDLDTGTVAEAKSRLLIRRAIVTSFSARYKFSGQTDGTYQKDDLVVIIDYMDLPEYDHGKEDYFVYKGKKYLIVTYEQVEKECQIFVIRHVQNEPPLQEIVLNIRHNLIFKQDEVQS